MNEDIYNNDLILKNLKKENKRGELTLFFGALAGVGKTYTMLKNAIELLNNGTNIVIGYVEKHGRAETEELIDELPQIPLKKIGYRKKIFYELDLDAIIKAKPAIVLIDELAHTNVNGSRHQKRYQDVLEILDNGIDVYCTMNVQHIESLNDIIFQITGIRVKETVPDSLLDRVDKIQIIDIPPEKLVNRLNEGKIYKLKSIEKALMNFFRLGNINALREIALKEVTKRVSKDVYNQYEDKQTNSSIDKIMVCIDSSDFSAKLIRYTKRLASQMNAPWIALYVENFGNSNIEKISENIKLAEELGAEVNTIAGENTANEVLKYAKERFVTHIVIAKRKKYIFLRFFKPNIPNEILSTNSDFCIILYSNNSNTKKDDSELKPQKVESTSKVALPLGIGLLFFISILCMLLKSHLELLNIALLHLIPALIISSYGNIKKSIIVALLSIGMFNYFFIPPLYTFAVADITYILSFFIFIIVAYLISTQSKKLKHIGDITREREKSVRRLFKLSRRVSATTEIKQVVKIALPLIAKTLKQESLFFINQPDTKKLELYAYYDPNSLWYSKKTDNMFDDIKSILLSKNEEAVLSWCYENRRIAGFGTDTFGALNIFFIPILNNTNTLFGIFAFKVNNKNSFTIDTRMFLESVINLMAISFERIYLFEQNKTNSINLAKEELKDILLSSISHDLRTPLSSILGMILVLKNSNILDKKNDELTSQIIFSIKKMERLLNNLLDSARFDSKNIVLKEDWHDISDIFYATTNEFKDILKDRKLEIKIDDLGIFKTDFILIERVLVNLLENAIKYSQKDSKIVLGFKKEKDFYLIYVQNEDSHIEDSNLSLIFERFFRTKGIDGDINGNGIGLFICKKIVELFGGYIEANNIKDGVIVSFYLPIKE